MQLATSNTVVKEKTEKPYKLKMREKLAFGLGDFGANFSWTFIASFMTIYLTDTVGMAAGMIGTIILVARLFDGISDLFMGNIIDNTKSKMGKAKPWVFWTAPPLALLTFMIFNVPSSWGSTAQIVYVLILYLLISAVFYTANNVAYSSLTSFMTKEPEERVALGSIRFMFAIAGVLLITSFTMAFVSNFGGGQRGWTLTALIAAFLCALPLMTTGWFVKERNIAEKIDKSQKTSFGPTFKALLKNKYFIFAIFLYVLIYLSMTGNGVQVYYVTYIFDNPNLMGPLSMASMLPSIAALIFAPKIVAKIGLRNTLLAGLVFGLVGSVICWMFAENVTWLLIGLILKSIGTGPLIAGASAIVADVGDLVYWKSGIPVQGSAFSITSAGMKIGQGLSSAMVGWILALGSYIPNAVEQPDSSIFAMKALFIYIPLIVLVLTVIVVAQFNHEKYMPKIRVEIGAKRVGEKRNQSIMS
ncbi:glycoside-pentoside-hexuronide (GPH):cation symporter [Mesobacillus maritimus]|uniref:MFS transporter n=1 Tax=Mesobacillus maritimus TaxID=1643336 RepID=UPI00203CF821|nr:glycoside-pentoside-hexuronide (GPH):cation symporter [Mesobacillus maritimus]MCM3671010.1 glycoside-pentoside-hexuronide (GPH):cation symporter [Mesobacillus maritimus]